jgi:branched-chain amino acid transport system ATP-binding protein
MTTDPVLDVDGVSSSYGSGLVLEDVSLTVGEGEVVGLLGRNGAGKTTTLRSIAGVIEPQAGSVRFRGQDITSLSDHEISNLGISYVVEERAVFPDLTVTENLRMGGIKQSDGIMTNDEILEWMPRLEERQSVKASKLSGGEQQMLAIGRGLMAEPKILALDEPSEGLAPQITTRMFEKIEAISEEVTILLVEQHVHKALSLAERAYLLENGEFVAEDTGQGLLASEHIERAYL